MNHIVDAHVAYIKTIGDLNQDKAELLKRIKRLEEGGDRAILNSYLPDRLAVWRKAKEDKP